MAKSYQSSKGGRLAKLLGLVSLACFVSLLVFFAGSGSKCDFVRKFVYAFNDIPARVVLTVAAPWAEHTSAYARMQEYFMNQRLLMADFLVRQIWRAPGYAAMCVRN